MSAEMPSMYGELIRKQSKINWKATSQEMPRDGQICVIIPKDAIIEYQDFDSCIYLLSLYDAKRKIFLVENNIGDGFLYKEKEIAYWIALPEIDGACIKRKGLSYMNRV